MQPLLINLAKEIVMMKMTKSRMAAFLKSGKNLRTKPNYARRISMPGGQKRMTRRITDTKTTSKWIGRRSLSRSA